MDRNFINEMMTRRKRSQRRIQVYFTQTAPLIAYYRERGLLSEIDGAQPIEKVTADLVGSTQEIRMSWDRDISIKNAAEIALMRKLDVSTLKHWRLFENF